MSCAICARSLALAGLAGSGGRAGGLVAACRKPRTRQRRRAELWPRRPLRSSLLRWSQGLAMGPGALVGLVWCSPSRLPARGEAFVTGHCGQATGCCRRVLRRWGCCAGGLGCPWVGLCAEVPWGRACRWRGWWRLASRRTRLYASAMVGVDVDGCADMDGDRVKNCFKLVQNRFKFV